MAKDAKMSTIIDIVITGTNNSGHRKVDNTNSGRKSLKTQRLHCRRNPITTHLHKSAVNFSRRLI